MVDVGPPPAALHVQFKVECTLRAGETLVAAGSGVAFGAWDPQRSQIRFERSAEEKSCCVCDAQFPRASQLEFKFVVLGNKASVWEDSIPNRKLNVFDSSILYGAKFNHPGTSITPTVAPTRMRAASTQSRTPRSQSASLSARAQSPVASLPKHSALIPVASGGQGQEAPPPPAAAAAAAAAAPAAAEEQLPEEMQKYVRVIKEATQRRDDLRASILCGEAEMKKGKEASSAAAHVEAEASVRLRNHLNHLQGLLGEIDAAAASYQEKGQEQATAAECLAEEARSAGTAAAAARVRLEGARQSRAEVVAKGRAAVSSAEDVEAAAEAASAAAAERNAAIAAAAALLKQRAAARAAEAVAAERERDFRAGAVQTLREQCLAKEAEKEAAAEEARAAAAALAAHREEAARRSREHHAAVTRACARLEAAVAHRDMKSREQVSEEDRNRLAVAQQAAREAAGDASAAVKVAQARRDKAKASDCSRDAVLAAVCGKASTDLAECERVAASVSARLADRELAAHRSKVAHLAAATVAEAAQEEFEALQSRASGPLAAKAAQCVAEAEAAREATVAARKRAAAEEAPLRHKQEVEMQAITRLEEAEAKLTQALEAARTGAAVARLPFDEELRQREEASDPGEEEAGRPSLGTVDEVGSDPDAQEAAEAKTCSEGGHGAALQDIPQPFAEEATGIQNAEVDGEPDGEPGVCKEDGPLAALDTGRADGLASFGRRGESQQRAQSSTRQLLQAEIRVAEERLGLRKSQEVVAREEAGSCEASWQAQKEKLCADLQLVSLELSAAQEDLKAMKEMRAARARRGSKGRGSRESSPAGQRK